LRRLVAEKVDFVLVGGLAAVAHGASTVTEDVDVCIRFDTPTLHALFRALSGTNPRQRMTPDRPPLGSDPLAYVGFKNLYVVTDDGVIDFLGNITGLGPLDRVKLNAVKMDLGGFTVPVMGLEDLLTAKRAVGRNKDLRVVQELETVLARNQEK
jgi:predicted nucleotidyltransferase